MTNVVKNIIYENTAYANGKYSNNPTIDHLFYIFDKIIEAKATTEYIRVTPFYVNCRVDRQNELDDFMFYLECRETFDENDEKEHILECIGKEYCHPNYLEHLYKHSPYPRNPAEQYELGKKLYSLCQYQDFERYAELLNNFRALLMDILPGLLDYAKVNLELKDEDLAFGYFCFEVHSD